MKNAESKRLHDDLADTEARLDSLRARYLHTMQTHGVTRAQTTTYNARAAGLCERRDTLRRMIQEAELDLPKW
ncbi:hypothetical protein M0R72_13570 [Candidatus Pacearchaeota archaeon]|nr:hypothetical protein [Candidatus Pacearchaeota archaeon]